MGDDDRLLASGGGVVHAIDLPVVRRPTRVGSSGVGACRRGCTSTRGGRCLGILPSPRHIDEVGGGAGQLGDDASGERCAAGDLVTLSEGACDGGQDDGSRHGGAVVDRGTHPILVRA